LAESTSSSERTLKLVVEYEGTDLCGWQRQDNGPTVQQHLEEAIRSMTQEETTILGASRTDAGVHALGQVAIFKTLRDIPEFGFRRGINTALPDSICVRSIEEVHADFHPRFDARGKHYRYSVLNRPTPSPLLRAFSWHQAKLLDLEAMREASLALVGEHDFSAFRASGCGAVTPHRRIDRIEVSREGDQVFIEVWGNAFLRNMVRIIAGCLVDAGHGRLSRAELEEIRLSLDRREAGQTAPAQGLCLVEVFFEEAAT
jgi:tRNA pseudouridine38-40 synthase